MGQAHFYIFNRTSDNELRVTIREVEKNFQIKLSQLFPMQDTVTYESLFALFFGLGWVENLSIPSFQRALEIILKGIK